MRPDILLRLVLGIIVVGGSEKSVKTSIHSKWSQTSILAEISEFLAGEDEDLFWKFVDIINANPMENSSDVSLYNFGISTASSLLDASEYPLLRFSIASRIFSPRIEVHRQISKKFQPNSCKNTFFVYGNQVGCQLSELNFKEYSGNAEIFEFDHIFPMKSKANRTLIIYGVLGTAELKNMILEAKILVETRENLNFALRFLSLSSGTTKVSLSGYGVELALKNTEYKAVDHLTQELPENLHGLNFRILKNRHTDRHNELESLRENLEKLGEIVPLKQWQLKDLGLKTCERIQEDSMELEEIERVLQDFPIHARTISHRSLNESFTKPIQKFQKTLKSAGIGNGENLLALNGRILSKSDSKIDLFELIETMKTEKKVMDRLIEIGSVSEDSEIDYSKLLTLFDFSPIAISKNAFDYRKTKPVFLNDLESFLSPYRSLHLLLQPFPSDQIRPIARNIFNLILFIDPFDSEDKLLDLAQKYLKGKVFIRIGLVPFFNENKWGVSVQEGVNSKEISKEARKIWKTNEDILKALKNGNEFLLKTGLGKGPQALLNGYPLDLTSSSESFDAALFDNIQKQTLRLQLALYQRLITDSVKIDDFWLKEETNPDLKTRVSMRIVKAFNERRFVELDSEASENPENPTLAIIANFENTKNRLSITKWLKSLKFPLKIALISNPTTSSDSEDSSCPSDSENLESAILRLENQESCIGARKFSNFLRKNEIKAGEMAVIFNGLVIGPFEENEKEQFLEIEDFEFLENLWKERGAKE